MTSLVDLPLDITATIMHVYAEPELYKRLYALGVRVGGKISIIRRASFNGPLHIRLGTTDLVLRRDLAEHITIEYK
jgi:ferrous iron transport protein A